MKGDWPDDIVRLLGNWAMWLACDRNPGLSHSSIYAAGPEGRRAESTVPLLSGEAADVDAVVCKLAPRYQKPLQMHYCWPGKSDRTKAYECRCSLNTYKARLDDAHWLFVQAWRRRQIPPSRVAA